MANDLNSCSFIGRLGKDPETKFMPSGEAVTNLSIAVGWKTKEKEGAEWISLVAFGKLAEICGEYLKKGSQIYAQGRMRTRKWQDKEGRDRYTTEVVMDRMQMLGPKPDGAKAAKPVAADEPFDDNIDF
jgi:single-strand DNA-binding protein